MASTILTAREKLVFELLIMNKSTKEIASELGISEKTVISYIYLGDYLCLGLKL